MGIPRLPTNQSMKFYMCHDQADVLFASCEFCALWSLLLVLDLREIDKTCFKVQGTQQHDAERSI